MSFPIRPTPEYLSQFDLVHLRGVELWLRIGISSEERALPQRVTIHFTLYLDTQDAGVHDDLTRSVDYSLVHRAVAECSELECKTVEFLAEHLADIVLKRFAVQAVSVCVEKYPLPHVQAVAVEIVRAYG